jgi:hypothetical protein
MADLKLNVVIGGVAQSVSTLGEVEQALRDTRAELEGVAIGSEAFKELTTQARILQGQLEQVEKSINFEQSINLLGESVGRLGATVASGFAVITSAFALFGDESEELTQAQIKAQQTLNLVLGAATIASNLSRVGQDLKNVSDALGLNLTRQKTAATSTNTVVTGINTAAQEANATATTAAATATRGFTAALAANPIGAIVVGLTLLVTALVAFGGEAEETYRIQEDLNEEIERGTSIIDADISRKKELIKVEGQLKEAKASTQEEALRIRLETQARLDELDLEDIDNQIRSEKRKLQNIKETYNQQFAFATAIFEKQKTLQDRNIIIQQDAVTQQRIQIVNLYKNNLISAETYYNKVLEFEENLAKIQTYDSPEEKEKALKRINDRKNITTALSELEKDRTNLEKIQAQQRELVRQEELRKKQEEAKKEAERLKAERQKAIEDNDKELEAINDAIEKNEIERRKLRIQAGEEGIRINERLLDLELQQEIKGVNESLEERKKEINETKSLSRQKKDALIKDVEDATKLEIDSINLLFEERRKIAVEQDEQLVLEAEERSTKLKNINDILQSEIRFGDQDTLDSFEALQIKRDELQAEQLARFAERQLNQEGTNLIEYENTLRKREELLLSSLNRREQIELKTLQAENLRNLTALAEQLEQEFELKTDFDSRVLQQVLAFTDEQAKIERDALLARQETLNNEERAYLALLQTRVNQTEETQIKTTEITQQYADQRVQIENEADDKILAKRLEVVNTIFSQLKDATQALRSDVTEPYFAALDVLQQGISDFLEIQDKEFATAIEKVAAYASAALSVVQGILSAISDANATALQNDLEEFERVKNEETDILTRQLNSGLITREQYDKSVDKLDKDLQKKSLAAKKKAFEEDKNLKIAQAIIAGLQGALTAFAGAMQLGPIAGPIVGGLLAAAVTTLTGVQIAAIKSTKFDSGGTTESINVPNVSEPGSELQQQAGSTGGFTQFNSALTGTPQGGSSTTTGQGMTDTRVYVLESDISSVQRRVQVAESTATFG